LLLLSLFLLLRLGLLLFLFRRVVALLPLLILLRSGLLLLFRGVVLPLLFCRAVALLPLLILLPLRLPLLFGFRLLVLLLPFRLSLFFLFLRFLLPCVRRETDPEQQEKRGCLNDSNSFHGVAPVTSTSAPITRNERRDHC
jgi:hypothetical protein